LGGVGPGGGGRILKTRRASTKTLRFRDPYNTASEAQSRHWGSHIAFGKREPEGKKTPTRNRIVRQKPRGLLKGNSKNIVEREEKVKKGPVKAVGMTMYE